jgi:hypothetical protein
MILDPTSARPKGDTRRQLAGAIVLAGAACVLWFALGMDRGTLLANDIKAVIAPWSAVYPERTLSGAVLTDPVLQFVPWLRLARRELLAGRLPLWNPHQDGGVPLLANFQCALGSPLLWPALLLGIHPGWNLSLMLRLLLALASAYAWLREEGRSTWAAAIGACGFALSGPFIAWLEHPHTAAAAAVPLLLLFAGRLGRRPARRDLIALSLATYLVLSGGHPETQLLAALLVAATLLFQSPRPASLVRPAAGAILGAGLAAPLLFPFLEYFRLSAARWGIDRATFTLPPRDLLRFLFPHLRGSDLTEGAATVSVTILVLALAGVARGRKDRKTIFWAATAAVLVAIIYDNPVARLLASHTSVYWTRALLFLPIPLAFLGSAGLDELRERVARRGGTAAGNGLAALALLVALAELLAAAQGAHAVTSVRELSPQTPLLSRLEADPEAFRVLPLTTLLLPNGATDYGLDDLRGYDALAPLGWRERRAAVGRFFGRHTDVLRPEGLAPGGRALDLWNVKYLLLAPDLPVPLAAFAAEKGLDLEEIYAGPDGRIWRNRRAIARARLTVPGTVRIVERVPARWTLDVDAAAPATLVVANPFFPGWTARLDGAGRRLASRPGDPMALSVPAGRHRVELLYRPFSFWLGLLVAAACLAVLIAICAGTAHSRRGGQPENDRVARQQETE